MAISDREAWSWKYELEWADAPGVLYQVPIDNHGYNVPVKE